jgi:hypothetical protein
MMVHIRYLTLKLKRKLHFSLWFMQILCGNIHGINSTGLVVPNKHNGEEVNAEKTEEKFVLRDQIFGKFTTQRYV